MDESTHKHPGPHKVMHNPSASHRTEVKSHSPRHHQSSDTWKNYALVFLAGAVLLLSIANFWNPVTPQAAAVPSAPSAGAAVAAPAPTAAPAPAAVGGPLPDTVELEGAHILGDSNAPVTVVEYSDFQCPFCARATSDAVAGIKREYVDSGDVKIVFKHFPLSFHPEAEPAALASECAGEQDKFWEFHDLIFENQQSLSSASYGQWATQLNLDTAQFNECFDSKKYLSKVRADFLEGQKVGVRGTPGFLVEGELVSGAQPFAVFQQKIDALLAS